MKKYIICLIVLSLAVISCKKDWLDAKSRKSLVVPQSLSDYQAMMDNDEVMNGGQFGTDGAAPVLGEVASDDYEVLNSRYNALTEIEKNAYIWAKTIYNNNPVKDWNSIYRIVFYSNVVLSGTATIERTNSNSTNLDKTQGTALFHRAFAFFNLAQIFTKQYNAGTSNSDLGIPLRLNEDILQVSTRSTVAEMYQQIIRDLTLSLTLLPTVAEFKTQPGKLSVYALLARIYLTMGEYTLALENANACLAIKSELLDYNTLNGSLAYPIEFLNKETLFFNKINVAQILYTHSNSSVSPTLYLSYGQYDLRKTLLFKQLPNAQIQFRGSYSGGDNNFGGLALDETYLIKAECEARLNNSEAIKTLNALMIKRLDKNNFVPYTAENSTEALNKVLQERRKELLFRGLRWIDLRRLNKESTYAVVLKRIINGVEYTLPPNDSRYIFPIPDEVIRLSGIPQNER